eukprot:CAMPEP_0194333210 /NCGR_PEP_ID=MMETSP0171-20130528/61958_1 /TAXON_ID=218684 /ORGANISM="Corethron pennatum, Strain L29A3" /LENGTH=112 /DNA_ID=CAMNT_0039095357 /DNA_START=12 /DNA_END=346 /DNA_ORIENTATION=+
MQNNNYGKNVSIMEDLPVDLLKKAMLPASHIFLAHSPVCCSRFRDLHDKMTSHVGAVSGRMDWVERGGVFDERTCRTAAAGGQLRLLQRLRGRGCPWDSGTCTAAAGGGHLG